MPFPSIELRPQWPCVPKAGPSFFRLVVSWYSLDARRLDFDAATYLTDGSNRGFSPGHRSERYQLLLKCHLIHSGKQNQRNPQSPRWLEKEAGKRLLRIITPSTAINVNNQSKFSFRSILTNICGMSIIFCSEWSWYFKVWKTKVFYPLQKFFTPLLVHSAA